MTPAVAPWRGLARAAAALCTSVVMLALSAAAHQGETAAGTFEIDWTTEQVESTLAVGIFQTLGLRVDNDPSRCGTNVVDGQRVLQGTALSFAVRDEFAFDVDEDIRVEIEMLAPDTGFFYYTYDRNGTANALQRFDTPAGETGWQTYRITLPRARFANRGFRDTDFAIASNIDFTDRLLFIRSLRFEREAVARDDPSTGILELTIRDTTAGRLTAAQVGLYDRTGRMPLPGEMAVELQLFEAMTRSVEVREELDNLAWPHSNRFSMYVDGYYRSAIPEGEYTLIVVKGPEYPIVQKKLQVHAGKTSPIEVSLPHSLDMPSRGWYSGDVHNHLGRRNSADNANQLAHARATDLHMHWLAVIGNSEATHFEQYAFGREGHYREGDFFLGSGQECPRTDFLGHTLSMGHDEYVRFHDRYLRYDLVSERVHETGGIFGIAHMDFPQFQRDIGLALLAPMDQIDFVEVMQFNAIATRDWYAFLNLGFELPAAAGSDWPYMSLPGLVRTYVRVEGQFDPVTWNAGLKKGRSFVTNGPMLSLTVNGRELGSRLELEKGDELNVLATAEIDPTWDLLTHLELIVNGEVVDTIQETEGRQRLEYRKTLVAEHGMWLAVRAWGQKGKEIVFQAPYTQRLQAHSGPIYVHVDGEPSWDRETGPAIARQIIERLQAFKSQTYERKDNEAWESTERTQELVEALRPELNEWVDRTIEYYRRLVNRMESAPEGAAGS